MGPLLPKCSSPDRTDVRGRAHHRRVLLTIEGLREVGHVRERTDHTVALGGVRVRLDAQPRLLRTLDTAPDLRPAEKETLLRGKPVDRSRFPVFRVRALLLLRLDERGVRDLQAPEVPDVLSKRQLSVDVEIVDRDVVGELPFDARRRGERTPGRSAPTTSPSGSRRRRTGGPGRRSHGKSRARSRRRPRRSSVRRRARCRKRGLKDPGGNVISLRWALSSRSPSAPSSAIPPARRVCRSSKDPGRLELPGALACCRARTRARRPTEE